MTLTAEPEHHDQGNLAGFTPVLVLSWITNTEYAERVAAEMQAHVSDGTVLVEVVNTVEEYEERLLTGKYQHAFIEWPHVPQMKNLRAWTLEHGVKAYKARYDQKRVRESYRGARSFKTILERTGAEPVTA